MSTPRSSVRVAFVALGVLASAASLQASGPARRLKDIVTTEQPWMAGLYTPFVESNGRLYFMRGNDLTKFAELWKTDGTPAGTGVVKDICPGDCASWPTGMTDVNGTLFFTALDPRLGYELWKTDGTAAGTTIVKDVLEGPDGSLSGAMTAFGGALFFAADDGTHGMELWKSDGTSAGTQMVADIFSGASSSNPGDFVSLGGVLLFTATDADGRELWRSDGTPAGTYRVKDIAAGATSSVPAAKVAAGGLVYFMASDGASGTELWRTDGTPAGTTLVKDINPGAASSMSPSEWWASNSMAAAGATLYFAASDGASGSELWRTDGTGAGTVRVKDILSGAGSSQPSAFAAFAGEVYFSADDGSTGRELWKTDGTEAGTVLVKDGRAGSASLDPHLLTPLGGTLLFSGYPGVWRTDGTAAGTLQIASDTAVSAGTFGGQLVFTGWAASSPRFEVWRTDGTSAGTVQLTEELSPDANVNRVVLWNGTPYFRAFGSTWKTDGTEIGTVIVANPPPVVSLLVSTDSGSVDGTYYFLNYDSTTGSELWKTDETPAGKSLVRDIVPGSGSSFPRDFRAAGGLLFFTADDGVHGRQLWTSDGTESGTKMVRAFDSAGPLNLTVVGGLLYFTAAEPGTGKELWRSDGTAAGTVLVQDIFPGQSSSSPWSLTDLGGSLYFVARDGSEATGETLSGAELWKSDGTGPGTVMVADILPGAGSSAPFNLTASGGTLFFTADDGVHGVELWKSDGTASGTVMVADVTSGAASTVYAKMAAAPGGGVLFMADDGIHGLEPWWSDGTPSGVLDVRSGAMDVAGDEGRLVGTRMIQDINPGPASGGVGMKFTPGVGGAFFGATDGETGIELWWLPPALSIDDAVVTETNGTVTATLTVTLSSASTMPVSALYQTVNGSATAGADYTAVSGVLTFLAGETSKTITIPVLGDTAAETVEALSVMLSAPLRAYIADGHGQVTIRDDENGMSVPPAHPQPLWHGFFAVDTRETPYVGDFDGDGRTDIITFTRGNPLAVGDVYVALSNGAGFGANTKWHDWFAISSDETVVVGDYNGDGIDDIATWLGRSTRQVYVALSNGTGMARETVWLNSIGLDASDVLLSGDPNGDGIDDLVLFARQQGKAYVALSTGSAFATPAVWQDYFAVSTYERPRVADVNGDGRSDIVTFATDSPTAQGDVYVALSTGTRFEANSTKWHDWFAIDPNEEIRIGDLNGDRKDDFFTFLPPSRGGEYYTVRSLGNAMAPNVLGPQKVRLDATDVVHVGDVNGDRTADIIVFAQSAGKVYVALAP